jgi:hypothetical protein
MCSDIRETNLITKYALSHELNSARRYWRDNFTKFDYVFVANINSNLSLTPSIIRGL